jgi:DNA polymerase-1
MTTNSIFNLNIPEECLSSKHEQYNFYKDKFGKERKKGKIVNFAISYGAGKYRLSQLIGENEKKSQEILDNYFKFYKGLGKKINETHNELSRTMQIKNMFGRIRHFTEFTEKTKKQSFNYLIQSMASDMLKIGLYKIWRNVILKYKDKIKFNATVHDELVFEIKEEYVDEIIKDIKIQMEDFDFVIPMIVEYGIGNNYKEVK